MGGRADPRLRARHHRPGAHAAGRACAGRGAQPGPDADDGRRRRPGADPGHRHPHGRLALRRHGRHHRAVLPSHGAGNGISLQAAYPACNSANDISLPARALAMTVGGLPSHTLPGPERPGKFRLMALMVT
ncbi:hypothetical protein G6F57_021819 [Rhizopus arrhizus]|nr:hypothetical protein G6F57_021819 [Rhizopus arrhizus]